jgi:hypothetical protein
MIDQTRFPLLGVGMWDDEYREYKQKPLFAEVTFIPMGSKCKCIIRGKVFCQETQRYISGVFMTTPMYMGWFGSPSKVRTFFKKGRTVKKKINLFTIYAPYHIHPCDTIV